MKAGRELPRAQSWDGPRPGGVTRGWRKDSELGRAVFSSGIKQTPSEGLRA